ncbi:FCD domain-containing protein [Arthrobacter sp. A5]|uniref:FCD domain-containing protein n=1 Tax=Arthrobacter sp. A5 TaxID=576926 RepID=UPI003DA7FFA7
MLALDGKESVVAGALRMRSALDPLTIEDAVMFSSAADIAKMREEIARMRAAMKAGVVRGLLRGNWRFQACVAHVSPNAMLRTVFLSLLDILEQHAVALRPSTNQPTMDLLEERMDLYVRMAYALEARDRVSAFHIMSEHNTGTQPASLP